jgi:cob(I)alamin adenosyltransferase
MVLASLLIYFGKGKGKTTAAFGMVIRALGRGWRVLITQFMKRTPSGEKILLEKIMVDELKGMIKWYVLGTDEFINPYKLDDEVASLNMAYAYGFLKIIYPKIIEEFKPKLVIFDELGLAIHLCLVDEFTAFEVLKPFIDNREVHAIVTGRYIPKKFRDLADLVTEVREIKHYFRKGFINVEGLDV